MSLLFTEGELQLALFGGLTGVQARLQNPGARVIAQREHDATFHSKFIARTGLPVHSLEDLKSRAHDLTITFGSESSTSGHLMPRYFLAEAGIDAAEDFTTLLNVSGSHDMTWQLVGSGSFDVGALNEDVWGRALRAAGASNLQMFVYGIFSRALPQFLTYLLYRWEVVIRTTVMVGFVSARGTWPGVPLEPELLSLHRRGPDYCLVSDSGGCCGPAERLAPSPGPQRRVIHFGRLPGSTSLLGWNRPRLYRGLGRVGGKLKVTQETEQ